MEKHPDAQPMVTIALPPSVAPQTYMPVHVEHICPFMWSVSEGIKRGPAVKPALSVQALSLNDYKSGIASRLIPLDDAILSSGR